MKNKIFFLSILFFASAVMVGSEKSQEFTIVSKGGNGVPAVEYNGSILLADKQHTFVKQILSFFYVHEVKLQVQQDGSLSIKENANKLDYTLRSGDKDIGKNAFKNLVASRRNKMFADGHLRKEETLSLGMLGVDSKNKEQHLFLFLADDIKRDFSELTEVLNCNGATLSSYLNRRTLVTFGAIAAVLAALALYFDFNKIKHMISR